MFQLERFWASSTLLVCTDCWCLWSICIHCRYLILSTLLTGEVSESHTCSFVFCATWRWRFVCVSVIRLSTVIGTVTKHDMWMGQSVRELNSVTFLHSHNHLLGIPLSSPPFLWQRSACKWKFVPLIYQTRAGLMWLYMAATRSEKLLLWKSQADENCRIRRTYCTFRTQRWVGYYESLYTCRPDDLDSFCVHWLLLEW